MPYLENYKKFVCIGDEQWAGYHLKIIWKPKFGQKKLQQRKVFSKFFFEIWFYFLIKVFVLKIFEFKVATYS